MKNVASEVKKPKLRKEKNLYAGVRQYYTKLSKNENGTCNTWRSASALEVDASQLFFKRDQVAPGWDQLRRASCFFLSLSATDLWPNEWNSHGWPPSARKRGSKHTPMNHSPTKFPDSMHNPVAESHSWLNRLSPQQFRVAPRSQGLPHGMSTFR